MVVGVRTVRPVRTGPLSAASCLETLSGPALACGDREAVEALLARLDPRSGPVAAAARTAWPTPETTAGLALLRAGLAALDGEVVPDPMPTAGIEGSSLLSDLRLALPLARVVAAGDTERVRSLPLPTLRRDRRDLWRITRMVMLAEGSPTGSWARQRLAEMCAPYRVAALRHDLGAWYDRDLGVGFACLMARAGWLLEDEQLCRTACDHLMPARGQLLVLGGLVPLGPVGWFLAEPLALLGRHEEAREANALAEAVSRRMWARTWAERCRQQARRLAVRPVVPAQAGQPGLAPASGTAPVPAAGVHPALSWREGQILELASRGMTNAQVATELFLSVATVERHFTNLYRKLGVRNRAQALGLLARRQVGHGGPELVVG